MHLELVKKIEDYDINIIFQSRSPPQTPEENQDQAQQTEEQNQEYDYCDFSVYIHKNNNGVLYECSSYDAEVSDRPPLLAQRCCSRSKLVDEPE